MIFNLFSNYGFIKQIQIFVIKKSALIEYQNVLFASQAKDYLSYKIWFGNKLKIYYSKYFSLDSRENVALDQEITFIPDPKFQLFKDHNISFNKFMQIKGINIPSETLHVSNISIHAEVGQMIRLFEPYGPIENIKYFDFNIQGISSARRTRFSNSL